MKIFLHHDPIAFCFMILDDDLVAILEGCSNKEEECERVCTEGRR